MPPRAIISAVLVLIGTLSGAAAPLNPAIRNDRFQPRSTLNFAVVKPAQARILGRAQLISGFNVQHIVPVWQTSGQVKIGRTAFSQPGGAVVQPVVIKAGGN